MISAELYQGGAEVEAGPRVAGSGYPTCFFSRAAPQLSSPSPVSRPLWAPPAEMETERPYKSPRRKATQYTVTPSTVPDRYPSDAEDRNVCGYSNHVVLTLDWTECLAPPASCSSGSCTLSVALVVTLRFAAGVHDHPSQIYEGLQAALDIEKTGLRQVEHLSRYDSER